jgi:hypothetical protein
MTFNVLIVLGYYVVALAAFTAWTYADHSRMRRLVAASIDPDDRLAERFARRVAMALGLLAALGTVLLLMLVLDPAPAILVALGVAIVDGAVTAAIAEIVLRFWGRWFRTDLLSDLRPAGAGAPSAGSGRDDRAAPSGTHTES